MTKFVKKIKYFFFCQAGYLGGASKCNLPDALNKARTMFSRSKRKHASQILIVITASRSSGSVRSYGSSMKQSGVSIFAMGIGRSNKNELRSICSSPQFLMFNWNFRRLNKRQIILFLSNLNNGTFRITS